MTSVFSYFVSKLAQPSTLLWFDLKIFGFADSKKPKQNQIAIIKRSSVDQVAHRVDTFCLPKRYLHLAEPGSSNRIWILVCNHHSGFLELQTAPPAFLSWRKIVPPQLKLLRLFCQN